MLLCIHVLCEYKYVAKQRQHCKIKVVNQNRSLAGLNKTTHWVVTSLPWKPLLMNKKVFWTISYVYLYLFHLPQRMSFHPWVFKYNILILTQYELIIDLYLYRRMHNNYNGRGY